MKKLMLTPVTSSLGHERREGEKLGGRMRIIVLLMFVPLLATRIIGGELVGSFSVYFFIKWGFYFIVACLLYALLKKDFYFRSLGYLATMLDITFVTLSIAVLSFFQYNHTGILYDPIYIGYLLICSMSALRFDYYNSLFSAFMSCLALIVLVIFDTRYHGIALDPVLLINRSIAVIMVTVLAVVLTKQFKSSIINSRKMIQKHVRDVSSVFEMGKMILRKEEWKKTLDNLCMESTRIIQSDFCRVLLLEGSGNSIDYSFSVGSAEQFPLNADYIDLRKIKTGLVALRNNDPDDSTGRVKPYRQLLAKEKLQSLIGIVFKLDNDFYGIMLFGRRTKENFSDYEALMMKILSEQVAVTITTIRKIENAAEDIPLSLNRGTSFENIIGSSTAMLSLFAIIEKAGKTDIPVLIRGESGTGKELVARALHNQSARKDAPFVTIDCASIPKELMESELFGYEKGAFTGAEKRKQGRLEQVQGGTIFLDEIGDLDFSLQKKLLRVLQEKKFCRIGGNEIINIEFRLVSATNQDLETMISKGEFREDLFYRIQGLPVYVPPLRERRGDIPLLVDHFMEQYGGKESKKKNITGSAMRLLCGQEWRGNVRELENYIHRLIVINDEETISPEIIAGQCFDSMAWGDRGLILQRSSYAESAVRAGCDFKMEIENFERAMLSKALQLTGGKSSGVMELINIPRSTLFYKISKYDLKADL